MYRKGNNLFYKKINIACFLILTGIHLSACNNESNKPENNTVITSDTVLISKGSPASVVNNKDSSNQESELFSDIVPDKTISDTSFISVVPYKDKFVFDMRYATSNNFLNEKVYDCPDCLLRKVVVDALLEASLVFKEKGYKIKFFDCYRPLDVQKKMWEIFPDARYVANPQSGSIHNRGGAVDITLVDEEGKELDMGTGFDHFGEEAHHTYTKLTDTVISNRKLLKEIMEAHGFTAQRTEWWHYNYKGAKSFPVANTPLNCND